MSAVDTLRDFVRAARLTVAEQPADTLGRIFVVAEVLSSEADRLDALASTLAHVDPAVLDLAAVVAADVAEAPLPDGWTAMAWKCDEVALVDPGGRWHIVGRWSGAWTVRFKGRRAHLADVVAAVTGATS